jgi:hypothetical protein
MWRKSPQAGDLLKAGKWWYALAVASRKIVPLISFRISADCRETIFLVVLVLNGALSWSLPVIKHSGGPYISPASQMSR